LGVWPENICRNLGVIRYYLYAANPFSSKPCFRLSDGTLKLVNSPVLHSDQLVLTLSDPESSPLLAEDYWYDPAWTTDRLYYRSRVLRLAASVYDFWRKHQLRDRIYSGSDPSGIELTAAIAEQFAREVTAAGATPIVLILPMRVVVEAYSEDDSFPLVKELKRRSIRVIDTGPAMLRKVKELGRDDLFPRAHLPPGGNELLSEEIDRAITHILQSEGN
jgi:hypothetical protein